MKKIFKYTASVLLAGLFLSKASVASNPDGRDIPEQCFQVASLLNHMASSKSEDRCSGDLRIAAAYIGAAGFEFRYQKIQQALASIKRGELGLQEIGMTRSYCSQMSPLVKPVTAKVILLASEIEMLSYINRTIKPDQ